ncbi:hypothetical protein [Enhygromyxa salina]|uniref:Uncharacterized protein n=1 Tax=Enhygromyxa salina TaxID=215803 RepID=A0A2S9YQ95_9BACT|nr:hypothetical protein [Enhygromyxa salina]PRQ07275.1 hypothetical protein ENSA7_29830 [Enhygromyxa salina]
MERFSGADELPIILDTLVALVVGVVVIWVAPPLWSWWLVGPIAAVVIAAGTGSRYRVSVDDSGVHVVLRRLWVVPVKRLRYRLDASVELYLGSDLRPIGLCVQPYSCTPEFTATCFRGGRPVPELERIRGEIEAAIVRARARVEVEQRQLQGPLAALASALEIDELARGPGQRFLRATSVAPFELGGVQIPTGSTVELNDADTWLDPRRDDQLRGISVSRPTFVPPLGRELPAGTRLIFDEALSHVALLVVSGEIDVDGFCCSGEWGLSFTPDGALRSFTLAGPWTTPTCTLPVDVLVRRTRREDGTHGWRVILNCALSLPGVGLRNGDRLYLAADGSLVSFFRSGGSIRVGDQELECGVVAIPLSAAGHVDLVACRERRVPMRPC